MYILFRKTGYALWSILLLIMVFNGCSSEKTEKETAVNSVKNSVMRLNKNTTVGKAFDNWAECSNKRWDEFQTSNGQQVVEFSCTSAYFIDFLNDIQKNIPKKDQGPHLDIVKHKKIFQWKVDLNGVPQLSYVGVENTWKDGKKYSDTVQNMIEVVQGVYNNETSKDLLNKINASPAPSFAATMVAGTFYIAWQKRK